MARGLAKATAVAEPHAFALNDLSTIAAADERSTGHVSAARRDWIVCQIGAREHYALAAELHRRGRLRVLCTDIWANEGSVWRAVAALSPSRGRKLCERYEPLLRDAVVATMTPARIMAAAIADRWPPGRSPWALLMEGDRRFAGAVARRLERSGLLQPRDGRRPTVFAYSYAACEILAAAKRAGCFTVLGQIDPGPEEHVLVAEIARRHGLPSDDTGPALQLYWDNWRRECALADLVLVNSEWSATLAERGGAPPGKLRVIPLAFRPDAASFRARRGRAYPKRFGPERPLELLFLGQVNIRKGVLELLEAMRRLRDAPVRLRMVGRADQWLRERAKDAPDIEWIGQVARSEAVDLYRRADVFILPTHSDGFAITQLEALAHDLPVIASRNCGEVIEHGRQGLRLEQVTAEAIEGAVRHVLAHPEALAVMSARASARLAHFSPERVVDALVAAVEEACA